MNRTAKRSIFFRGQRRGLPGARTLTMALLLLSLVSAAAPAAAQGTSIRHTTTTSAIAQGELVSDAGYAFVDLYIGPGKDAGTTILCLSVIGDAFEEGCADVTATFSMDTRHLASADLPATPVTLVSQECDKSGNCSDPIYRTVTVAATWTGAGNRMPVNEILGDPTGSCTEMHVINGFVQDSIVTMTIDGVVSDASGNLQAIDATQTWRTNCA